MVAGGDDDVGARAATRATLLPASIVANGQVLVAGGTNGSGTLSSRGAVQRHQHLDGDAGDAGAPCRGTRRSLLGNNMVLIAGGLNGYDGAERGAPLRCVVRARLLVGQPVPVAASA